MKKPYDESRIDVVVFPENIYTDLTTSEDTPGEWGEIQ